MSRVNLAVFYEIGPTRVSFTFSGLKRTLGGGSYLHKIHLAHGVCGGVIRNHNPLLFVTTVADLRDIHTLLLLDFISHTGGDRDCAYQTVVLSAGCLCISFRTRGVVHLI